MLQIAKKSCEYNYILFAIFGRSTANLGLLSRGQPRSPDVNHYILCFINFQPKGQQESRNKVESIRLFEHLVGFKPETFRFIHNAVIHQVTLYKLLRASYGIFNSKRVTCPQMIFFHICCHLI